MKPMTIKPMAVARLRPFPNNARTHSDKQIRQLADSIQTFGFTTPVLIGDDDEIIAGHGRVAAAKLIGLTSVPTLRLSGLDGARRRAYALADNQLALAAGWDRGLLAIELQALVDLDFDIEVTGFSLADIDLVLDETPAGKTPSGRRPADTPAAASAIATPADLAPDAVTRDADQWLLDRHHVFCDGTRNLAALDRVLLGEPVVFVARDAADCDRIVQRFRHLTGHDAVLAATGASFAEVARQRRSPPRQSNAAGRTRRADKATRHSKPETER